MRILIVRLSSLGDVVDTMPVACALRDHHPSTFIAWVVEEPARGVLDGHEAIDELVVVPPGWLSRSAERRRLAERLRALRLEVALDVQSLTRSAVAAWQSGAPRRIGLGGAWWQDVGQWFDNELFHGIVGREASRWLDTERVAVQSRHVVDAYLELLRPLGVTSPRVRFGLPVHPSADAVVERWLETTVGREPFVMINPGGSKMARRWPDARFGEVARYLVDTHRMPVVVHWVGERERAWADRVVAATGGRALAGPVLSLPEFSALIARARMFMSGDTGPLQMAWAIGTPCVALFGDYPAFRNGPYGAGHVTVEKAFKRGNVFARQRENNDTMLAIGVDDVCEACDRLLERPSLSDARVVDRQGARHDDSTQNRSGLGRS